MPLAVERPERDDPEGDDDLDQDRPPEGGVEQAPTRPTSTMPCTAPVSSRTASAGPASREKLPTTAASRGVRWSGASVAVALRSANTSTAIPPSHALTARTCRTFAGSRTAT